MATGRKAERGRHQHMGFVGRGHVEESRQFDEVGTTRGATETASREPGQIRRQRSDGGNGLIGELIKSGAAPGDRFEPLGKMVPVVPTGSWLAPNRYLLGKPGIVNPRREAGMQTGHEFIEIGSQLTEVLRDRAGHPFYLGELFGHVVDEHAGEELHLVGSQVIAALPLVQLGEELRQFGRELLVQIEHRAHRVGKRVRVGATDSGRAEFENPHKTAVEFAKSTGVHVTDFVDAGEYPLDEFEDLLALACDEVSASSPVVVVETRRVADRGRHREVSPAAKAFEPIADNLRIDAHALRGSDDIVGGELGEERSREQLQDGPIVAPFLPAEVTEELPGPLADRVSGEMRPIGLLLAHARPTRLRTWPSQR